MSAELNAENRTSSRLATRRCSFCRNAGHNISRCDDIRLHDFEQLCIETKSYLSLHEFRGWLEDYAFINPLLVRSYAVSKCGCSVGQYRFSHIEAIIIRIRMLIENAARQNVNLNLFNDNSLISLNLNIDEMSTIQLIEYIRYGFYQSRDLYSYYDALANRLIGEESLHTNRKFNIQTSIVECLHTDEHECGICYDTKAKHNFIKLNCDHEFCDECVKQSLKNVRTENPQCAFCRTEIKNMEVSSQSIRNEFNDILTI